MREGFLGEVALDLVARELRSVKARCGNEAIYGGSYGWASAGDECAFGWSPRRGATDRCVKGFYPRAPA
jgi:hypothetical protein